MYACEIDIPNVVCRVVIPDLAAGPVDAFNFHSFVVFDGAAEGYCRRISGRDAFARFEGSYHLDANDSVDDQLPMGANIDYMLTCRHSCSAAGLSKDTLAAQRISCLPIAMQYRKQ
jgi:hypothetical protein